MKSEAKHPGIFCIRAVARKEFVVPNKHGKYNLRASVMRRVSQINTKEESIQIP